MEKSKRGDGVHKVYRDNAKKGFDILFRVKIKGRSTLIDGIPLHMSLKIFKDKNEFDVKEIEEFVNKNKVFSPDPKDLSFEPIIFKPENGDEEYYMLKVKGLGPQYKALYDEYDDVGNVYKEFFTHITIDKPLYEDAKKNGISSKDIEFSNLILEAGAGNTMKDFKKSEPAYYSTELSGGNLKGQSDNSPYDRQEMLDAIARAHGQTTVPSELGLYTSGHNSYSHYGLNPDTIKETIMMNNDLKDNHGKMLSLRGDDMRRYMDDNPGLDDEIAEKHMGRLEHHFGPNPLVLAYAWAEGIRNTYNALKKGKEISNHWHVKKIQNALGE